MATTIPEDMLGAFLTSAFRSRAKFFEQNASADNWNGLEEAMYALQHWRNLNLSDREALEAQLSDVPFMSVISTIADIPRAELQKLRRS
jgi:hypothetical protein